MTVYLLDSDTLIRAKNEHYGFDLCPGHWNWLDNEHAAGKVFSVRKVYDELLAGQDDLSDWAKQRKPFFLEPNDATRASLAEVSAWANGTQYQPNAVNLFLHKADYFGMAEGHASKMTVVTYEKSAPTSRSSIKIPDACKAMGVDCIAPHRMLRAEGAQFDLRS